MSIEYDILHELDFSNLAKDFAAQKSLVCELVLCFILSRLLYEFLIYCSQLISFCLNTFYICYHPINWSLKEYLIWLFVSICILYFSGYY